jgi:CRISPR-associated protein Cas2
MWVVAMFDLPMHDKALRKAYARFRKGLIRQGFDRLQFSVYARHCSSLEKADAYSARVGGIVPDQGEVRVLLLTDKQFERMKVYWGKHRARAEEPPKQLELF